MKKLAWLIISFLLLLMLSVPNAFSSTCSTCSSGCTSPPSNSSSPAGDNPDDTYSVDSGFIREGTPPLYSDPNTVTFQNGYAKELTSFIDAYKKVEVKTDAASTALQIINSTPQLVIPSGGLYGYESSAFFKATLDEFVKQGGTLIVFAQQHGYDFSILPTPDGKPIAAYGWTEDQSCLWNGTYVDTYHQILSAISTSTVSAGVDGYFTSYPVSSTILLRRSANGQPAMLMYQYGQGRVIVSSFYTDWGYAHSQATKDELAIVRDMITWAKKPAALPEVKPGNDVSVPVTVTNSTTTDAATIRLLLYNPDRSALLNELDVPLAVLAGQLATTIAAYQIPSDASLGIHHVDYLLFDASGNVIQPQAETDSGRFVVSKPPQTQTVAKDIWLSITSPTQEVFYNEPFVYTFHIFNNTNTPRNLTIKTWLPHTDRRHEWTITANPNGETTVTGSDLFLDTRWMYETLRAYLYDESGKEIGSYMLSFKGLYPKVTVTTSTDKGMYSKGETVDLSVNLKNTQNLATAVKLNVTVADPSNIAVYANTQDVSLPASGTGSQPLSFVLPASAQGGLYTVSSELFDSAGKKIGGDATSFELPVSQFSVIAGLPAAITTGVNTFSFNLTNTGKLAVSAGTLEVRLLDPDGATAASASLPFALAAGQNAAIDVPINIPALKFGSYTLSYTQNDETRSGKPATLSIANTVATTISFDKTSYRIRETANLAINLTNTGRFRQENVSVAISIPDAGYSNTEAVTIAPNQNFTLNRAITLPDTMPAGQHTVNVTLTLPSGSSVAKNVTFTVPQSSLALSLNQTAYTAGSTVSPVITNSGGVDTQALYRISLYDAKSAMIADKSLTEIVPANGELTLNLPIPIGAVDGGYTLVLTYSDLKTGKAEIVQKNLTITGIKAALTVQTAKPTYLSTESITALSNIINSGTLLQGGNLHLQVSTATGIQKQKTWTSQFDFQQGIRNVVDTYGVNDWLIPDDDFDSGIDLAKWGTWGAVQAQSGKVLVDSSSYGSGMSSTWTLTGDFDVQVDFSNNNSCGAEGAEMSANGGAFGLYVKNTVNNGREAGAFINGGWTAWRAMGGYQQSGTLRIVRAGSTITAYNWNGTGWTYILAVSGSAYTANASIGLDVWRGHNCPANCKFDNFKVNSGRITTINETVDSVRLLRTNDNFDDGVLNADRWSVRSSGSVTTNETSGTLVTKDTQTGVQSYANVADRFPLTGDFDISIDWKASVAPASGDWGSIFQISEVDQNTAPDNNLVGNALQIKRAYVNGLGHIYQTGHYNGSTWDAWSSPITTADTSGKFRIKRVGSSVTVWYWNNSLSRWEWSGNTAGYSWSSVWTTPSYVQIGVPNNVPNNPAAETDWNNFKAGSGATYLSQGTIRLKQDAGQTSNWQTIYWSSTEPVGTSIKFRTRTAGNEADLANATWSDYLTSGSLISSPKGRWIELEATLATTNASVTPLLKDVTVTYGSSQGDILWQTDIPLNLAQGAVSDFTNNVGTLGNAGKYYLQGVMTSSTGQMVATYEYPFFVAQGNTALSVSPDKRVYKPGDAVTISGEVKNLSTVTASNVSFVLKSKASGGAEQTIYTETFSISAGGSHPFTVTTTAGTEETVTLTGTVTQGTATLAQTADQFDVSAPQVTSTVTLPDVAGADPFTINVEIRNDGKTDAIGSLTPSITSQPEMVTIPAGQKRLFQYVQQISADTSYTFTFAGDLNQTIAKTVKYGLAGTVTVAPQAVYVEGKVSIPATITNTGLLDSQYNVAYQVLQGGGVVNQQPISYFVTKGVNTADTLTFDLAEGSYQITAQSSQPVATASASFQVRKETKVDFAQTVGGQAGGVLSVTVNVTNLGYNPINGAVRLSLVDSGGVSVWNSVQDVSLPFAQNPAATSFAFNVNLSAVTPGNFTLKAELLDAANQQLAVQVTPFTLLGAAFDITQLPPYQTISAGGSATMTFKVKNSGNQEGSFDLFFKADDLIDSSQTAWLKPGEEKEVAFSFTTATDLEEKDYFAAYNLKQQGSGTGEQGSVKYHVAGINIDVTAALDRQSYREGETAQLTLTVTDRNTGATPNLFARVNYAGYEEKRDFTLNGSQTLTFAVPLERITGEKLFYGIYHQSGRSIHLNTIYIHKAGDALTITTDKQVYNPGETVTASLTGTVAGDLTLTGPGDFTNTFAFTGSDNRSFALPDTMTAGTYTINAQLKTQNSELITAVHPIDVAGIQVKVKEALLDKAKYAATDTMTLSLTIESNQGISATVKTWVVDPAGNYTPAGEGAVSLTASSPLLFTVHSSLFTESLGIHKLVYGIYKGDLLLASGAKAFDVGDAVLLGLATDKSDYPANTPPVMVKAELFGAVSATLELFLDGTSINSEVVDLTGFKTSTFLLQPSSITPGLHKLKGVLTTGGLTSVREASFTYGSSLPDLTARLSVDQVKGSTVHLTVTIANQGKTGAGQSTLTLYDGDPASGAAIASLPVPAQEPGASTTLTYNWSVLGKAGEHVLYAVADSGNAVTEFIEANNTSLSPVSLPNLSLVVTTGNPAYRANQEVGIVVSLANLTSTTNFAGAALKVELADPVGKTTILTDKAVATLPPAAETTTVMGWNTGNSIPGGYTVNARLTSGGTELVAGSASFTVDPTPFLTGSFTLDKQEVIQGFPLTIGYTLTNNGNIDLQGGEVTAEFIENGSGATTKSDPQAVPFLPLLQTLAQALTMEKVEVEPGDYTVKLSALAAGTGFLVGEKPLKVLPPLEVSKGLSLVPRVLVLVGSETSGTQKNGAQKTAEEIAVENLVSQALEGMGGFYRIVGDVRAFREELRTGHYNTYILSGSKPLTDHLDEELRERIHGGDGLVLLAYEKMDDVKFRELPGVKGIGYLNGPTIKLDLFESPITQPGSFQVTGKARKVAVESALAQVAGVLYEGSKTSPAVVLNPYGTGKVATFTFLPGASLVRSAVAYAAPQQPDVTAATPLPVETTLRSFGAGFDLKVREEADAGLPLLLAVPSAEAMEKGAVWQFSLLKDETKKLLALRRLPEEGGTFDLVTSIDYLRDGSYQPYKEYHLSITVDKGIVALKSGILTSLKTLPVSGSDGNKLAIVINLFENLLNRPAASATDAEQAIRDLLFIVRELRSLSADTTAIRLDLDRLIRVYERKWSELQAGGPAR